ncbi:helix-turn-helix transcriptional regulator [Aliiroseovarius sp. 2305UL8-7]|uniref:helix-turn-helix transcriptional regulator n=1 Tax=Aliiroseovarius conchicola TaxID=3121637 RepID=UPI003528B375
MQNITTIVVLIIAAIFFAYDIIADIGSDGGVVAVGIEALIFVMVLSVLAMEIQRAHLLRKKIVAQEVELNTLKGNLADTVKAQFEQWNLSKSECEVAWLVIKGFSFREISNLRSVAEKTVRKQAGSIYTKSNTSNRSEFTASFLEDLLDSQR